ncbi:FAD-binding protein [Alkalihalobacillus hemicellulosilyticus]|uniref:Xylitol oxidase n=1 Tax=Halalkalibacter hemicellulosilyticusJCM 9152 TaxID=1236971 RepID=W4QN59_9BACI|nr:FAD-binding protein [Halalkalibacter hemicellulosilyticus]GAE32784.1 xylitol oxidase [Halalkalibacter hemicellulosilyticusJCM 9152]
MQKNWAGNLQYSTSNWHEPETIEDLQQLVSKVTKLRVVGTRHSFNSIADSDENLVSLHKLNKVLYIDKKKKTVTVEAGIKYGNLCHELHQHGYALQNLASLPHISVAGACATATHGSGNYNQNLAAAVSAMEVVTANGSLVTFSRETSGAEFYGSVVGLGGIGVVTKLTLDIVPSYQMRQDVYENLPLAQLAHDFDTIFSSAYSVSLFMDWQDETINQVWLKSKVTDGQAFSFGEDFNGAKVATENLHPVPGVGAENCTAQLGVEGDWLDRVPHFRMNFTPSKGQELQSEYIFAREHAYEALCALSDIREHIAPHLLISEVRTIAKDELWMSPSYKQDSVAIHFTWQDKWADVQQVLPLIEAKLEPFQAKPHWGKLFTTSPEKIQSLYEKMSSFQLLLNKYDPNGMFRNRFLSRYIFNEDE